MAGPRMINRLRWRLHELDPSWDPALRSLTRKKNFAAVAARLTGLEGMVARIAAELAARIAALTGEVNALETEIAVRVRLLAPSLLAPSQLAVPGVAELTAAKIVAETAGVRRFKSGAAYPGTTAPRRCRYGRGTRLGTGCRGPGIGS